MRDHPTSSRFPTGRFFEEWTVGDRLYTSERVLGADEVVAFLRLTGDDNPLHSDREAPLVPGLLTAAMATGLVAQLGVFQGTTVALLRVAYDFLRPLRAPCSLRVELEVTGLEPWKRAGAGVVETSRTVLDGQGTVVARGSHRTVVTRKTSADSGVDLGEAPKEIR